MAGGALPAWLALLMAVAAACAGCASPPAIVAEPLAPALRAHDAEAGIFYQLHHTGGVLSLGASTNGRAQVELFGPNDERLGQLLLGGIVGRVGPLQLSELAPGDYVLRLNSLNGSLEALSDGVEPVLWPLAQHVERRILHQEPRSSLPTLPIALLASAPTTVAVDIELLRAPTALRVLSTGSFSDLAVHLAGISGTVLELESGQEQGLGPLGGSYLDEVPSTFHAEAVRDGHLWGNLSFSALEGAVVLESESYSRLLATAPVGLAATTEVPAFLYGPLPPEPVRFQLGSEATRVIATNNGSAEAWLALFSADGARLATFVVPAQSARLMPLVPETYIAALLAGNASLGADAAPSDFEMHPLEVTRTTQPSHAAGSNGEYGSEREAAGSGAIVYDVRPALVDQVSNADPFNSPMLTPCQSPTWIRVLAGGETAAFWDARSSSGAVAPHLSGEPVSIEWDGMGADGCQRPAAEVFAFHI